ncbi:tetratricopeptide repeat-containing sensor histidine kinase [Seonamhaeicola marinus]|uniref:histidine kinase n=1 Tax=Seonamhaeicola marinus TaxID=1912246 RepID=A0A5D0ILN0_9FLAO|nr:ATP-binding protein [Seonamhaeicola marinus]TYA84434.1 tetratricopeptide repeat protein [Seonamhaeicola marinus]
MRRIITLIMLLSMWFGFGQTKDIDSLIIELAYQKQDSTKVDTSLKLIKALFDIKEYDRALKHIQQNEKLASNISYEKGTAEIAYYKALIFAKKDDYINALSGYNRAISLFSQLNDTLNLARVNNSIGQIEIKRGNYTKGLRYSLASIKALEKQELSHDLKDAYSNLAKAYLNVGANNKAIEFFEKALSAQQVLGDQYGVNISNSYLGDLYSLKEEHKKAITYYEEVLANVKNDSVKGSIYPKLGDEYLLFKDYEQAQKYLVGGYNVTLRKKDNNYLTVLNSLGDLNIQKERLKTAEKQLSEATALARKLDNQEQLLKNYRLRKALDSTKKEFARAFVWQRRYYDLKSKIESEQTKNVLETQKAIETTPEEVEPIEPVVKTENESLNPKSVYNTSDLDKFNKFKLIFYGLLAALAIVSTFLVLIYLKRNSNIKYTQELEEKNLKIEMQNKAFQEQTKHLENVNNVKDKLFSIVSHDLKDSLSSINGFIELLRDGALSREEFDNLIPELSENANNASLLLFNLLNWSKSQMQSLEPKPSLFDIQEVFEDKIKLVEQRMESKGITLVDHSLRDFAYADRSMFEIVVQNLLANAIKFTKSGDTITISNHISNGSCIISIADTGIGISKENLEKLFKNTSFTTMGTSNEKGTGLGLSICKELVELNHGKIWVESTVNVGSTFYVQLPKSRPSDS